MSLSKITNFIYHSYTHLFVTWTTSLLHSHQFSVLMSMEYLCMLGLRGAMGSCLGGGRWPQKSGKARMLNPGIDLVLAAAAQYSLGSWWGIQAPCLSNNLSIIIWWRSSVPSSSSSCWSSLWPGGASSLGAENNNKFRQLGLEVKGKQQVAKKEKRSC